MDKGKNMTRTEKWKELRDLIKHFNESEKNVDLLKIKINILEEEVRNQTARADFYERLCKILNE